MRDRSISVCCFRTASSTRCCNLSSGMIGAFCIVCIVCWSCSTVRCRLWTCFFKARTSAASSPWATGEIRDMTSRNAKSMADMIFRMTTSSTNETCKCMLWRNSREHVCGEPPEAKIKIKIETEIGTRRRYKEVGGERGEEDRSRRTIRWDELGKRERVQAGAC